MARQTEVLGRTLDLDPEVLVQHTLKEPWRTVDEVRRMGGSGQTRGSLESYSKKLGLDSSRDKDRDGKSESYRKVTLVKVCQMCNGYGNSCIQCI
jgi:hypothetical protein